MLAFSRTKEDDFVGYLVTDHSIVRALQVEQYSNKPGTRVVSFGRHKNFWGDAYAAKTRRI